MPYCFVKVASYYPNYLKLFYKKNSNIKIKSYNEHLKLLMSDCFSWSDFVSKHLRNLGVESYEIVENAKELQKQWAIENKFKNLSKNQILIEQLKSLRPDVLFINSSTLLSSEWISLIRNKISSIKLIVTWWGVSLNQKVMKAFQHCDLVFVCLSSIRDFLIQKGIKSYHVHHSFESKILELINRNNSISSIEASFIGSIFLHDKFHYKRKDILERIIKKKFPLILYGQIIPLGIKLWLKNAIYYKTRLLSFLSLDKFCNYFPYLKEAINWQEAPNCSYSLKRAFKKPLFGLEMYEVVSRSKISFNCHIDFSDAEASNMRLFEATGVASCLLTDWKPNLSELFKLDEEIVTYKSAEECIEKLKWLLDNPLEREKIAKAGQKRTLKNHCLKDRVEKIHKLIYKKL